MRFACLPELMCDQTVRRDLVMRAAVTHGHLDHVGAIEPLIDAYPDLLVIFHETEAPFLLGDSKPSCYNYMPSGLSLPFKLLQFLKLLPPVVQYKVYLKDSNHFKNLARLSCMVCKIIGHCCAVINHLLLCLRQACILSARCWLELQATCSTLRVCIADP